MKRLLLFVLPLMVAQGQTITWSLQSPTGNLPDYNGFLNDLFDPVSGQRWHFGIRHFSATVTATNASPNLVWVSGDKFSPNWQGPGSDQAPNGDQIFVGGTSFLISSVTDSTHLIMTTNYTGTTGNVAFVADSNSIFSTDHFFYNSATSTFTAVNGSGSLVNRCVVNTATQPGDRHPDWGTAIDTRRGWLWLFSGLNQQCGAMTVSTAGTALTLSTARALTTWVNVPVHINGVANTVLSCSSSAACTLSVSAGTQTSVSMTLDQMDATSGTYKDLWYLVLNANPANDVWKTAPFTTFPVGLGIWPGLVYDPDDDILVMFGPNVGDIGQTWVYCRTTENPTPGTLTSKQSTAGCAADDWAQVTTSGGTPPGVTEPSVVWDTVNHVMLQFGGTTGGGVQQNQTWAYTPSTKTWAQKCGGACTAPPTTAATIGQSAVTYNPGDGCMYYHVASAVASATNNSDWKYCFASDTWTQFGSGSGPTFTEAMVWDATAGALIAHNKNINSGVMEVWKGTISTASSISVPITVQEALPINLSNCSTAASCGVTRSEDSFRSGVPFPDSSSTGLTAITSLGLTGCTSGQFRSLVTWPSGRIKWLEVQGTPSTVTAGGTTTCTLNNNSGGNFGGFSMATDNGTTITVATGTATYTIKKANFNLIDIANVGTTSIIVTSAAATRGIVLTGPANPGTTCGTCTTAFSSSNDASSTAAIEENGPAETVIKATGALKDGSGNVYLRFTVREHFYRMRSGFKVHLSLQNADDSANGSFATAFKNFASVYAQIDLVGGLGTMKYTFGGRASTIGPTNFTAAETASILQLYSNFMQDRGFGDPGEWDTSALPQSSTQTVIPRSSGGGCTDTYCYPDSTRTNEGYSIKDGVTSLETGTRAQIPVGWADTASASGVGAMIGVSYLSAYWPKSVELQNGGNTIAIGLRPTAAGLTWWLCYTCYEVEDFYIEPHATNPSSLTNDFLKYQYDLIGASGITQINNAAVFPWGPIPAASTEDDYWNGLANTFNGTGQAPSPAVSASKLCCSTDSISGAVSGPYIFRYYAFGATGGINESDISESYLLNFITRGQTGKYVFGRLRQRFMEESVFPRSDFASGWRGKTYAVELDALGFPTGISSANSSNALQSWRINEGGFEQHAHWGYGTPTWYYTTGEEHYADTIKQGVYDWATNAKVPSGGCSPSTTPSCSDLQYPSVDRAIGPKLIFSARIHDFAASLGDSTTAANAYTVAEQVLNKAVRPTLVSPKASCTNASCSGSGDYGTDQNRGFTEAMAMYQGWNQPSGTVTEATGNGSTTAFSFTLSAPRYPLECGGPSVFPTVIIKTGTVTATDDTGCVGTLSGTGVSSGTVNYSTGAVSITFSAAPGNGAAITAYFFYPVSAATCPQGSTGCSRVAGVFQENLLINGLLEYARSRGPSWTGCGTPSCQEDVLDIAYGGANNWVKNEMICPNAPGCLAVVSNQWLYYGLMFGAIIDYCNDPQTGSTCHADGPHNAWWANPATTASPSGAQTVWWGFDHRNDYYGDRGWITDFQANLYQVLNSQSLAPNGMTEYGRPDISALIYRAQNPLLYPVLTDLPITGFVDQGSGNYQLSWTVPGNLKTPTGLSNPYKFKWGTKNIVASMQFDPAETNTYGQSTSTKMPWFAATNVTNEPAPGMSGTTQSYVFATGTTGLVQADFSLKAYLAPGCSISPSALGPWINGQSINITLQASGCNSSTFTITSGAFPNGLSMNSSGNISGTITRTGQFNVTVAYDTASLPYTIIVNPAAGPVSMTPGGVLTGGIVF